MPHGSCCDSQRLVRENHGTALLQFGNSQRLCVKLSRLCFAANRSDLCAKLSPPGFCCNSQRLVLKLTARLCRNSATRKDFARSSPNAPRLVLETHGTFCCNSATCKDFARGSPNWLCCDSPRLVRKTYHTAPAVTRNESCLKLTAQLCCNPATRKDFAWSSLDLVLLLIAATCA